MINNLCRPISFLISNHNFIETNNTLYDNQFGFHTNHSTTHAVITHVERVSKALDIGKTVVVVHLDL